LRAQARIIGGVKKVALIAVVAIVMFALGFLVFLWSRPERGATGELSTRFRWLGPNDRIAVDGFDDPKVKGVACHISRAVTGGIKGGLGLAEDTSDASIACRQVGPIQISPDLKDGEHVFDERRSLLFKHLHVVRFYDRTRNVLVYVTYSDRVIEGSPKNSISSVPVMGWVAP
jgi:CreA protein